MRRYLSAFGSSARLGACVALVTLMTLAVSQIVQGSPDQAPGEISASPAAPASIVVSNEDELKAAVDALTSGATILIAPGTYRLTSTLRIDGSLADVTLKGSTGRPADVVLEGAGMSVDSSAPTAIRVAGNVQRLQIADLTIQRFSEHAILLEAGPRAARLSNLRLFDSGQALLRVSAGDSAADEGIVEDSMLGYTNGGEGAFAGGIDLQGVRAWTVRRNTFRNIRTLAGDSARPAVAAGAGSSETLVQQNRFFDCQIGVAFGLVDIVGDHSGGLISDNFVYRSPSVGGGPGIFVGESPDTTIAHNTVVTSATYPAPIEYRYVEAANLTVVNNLVDGAISPLDGAWAFGGGNVVDATPDLFVSAAVGDLHLQPSALLAIDAGESTVSASRDIDGDGRPSDGGPDAGADEIDRSNAYPTVDVVARDPGQGDDTVDIEASAYDQDGTIAAVEFYVDAALIARVDGAPYVTTARITAPGPHSVIAIAVDNAGGRTASAPLDLAADGAGPDPIASDDTLGSDGGDGTGGAGTSSEPDGYAAEQIDGAGEVAAAALLMGGTYLSDMAWISAANGWGPVERDRSNGERGRTDGRTITLNGVRYAKGLGAHAASDIRYALDSECSAFYAVVGVDDEPNSGGNVVFQVYLDNVKRFDSGVMNGRNAGRTVNVSLAGANVLRLVITDAGNGRTGDHGDWADAQVVCGGGVPTSPEVSGTSPSDGAANVARNTNVTATFSTAMAVSSLTTATMTLVPEGGTTPVAAAVTYAAPTQTATLNPFVDLDASTTYTATIKGSAGGATDAAGTPLAVNRSWTFTTADAIAPPPPPPPSPAPTISGLTPPDDATGVGVTTNVTATFSTAMLASSLTTASVTLVRQGTTTPIEATVAYATSTSTVTLNPSASLAAGTVYTATIKGGVAGVINTLGISLAADTSWTFTTAAAQGPPATGNVILPGEDIQGRVAAASNGTAFILAAGLHRMQAISPKEGQSFTGELGTILSGARLLTAFTRSGSYWVASGQTQAGVVSGDCEDDFPRCDRPEELFLNDQRLLHVSSLNAVGPGKWYFDYAGDRIYFWDDPTGRKVETSVTTTAFLPTANNVTISNLIVEKYANPGQRGAITSDGRSGWVITANEVRLNHGSGIGIGSGARVTNNYVHHNGQLGMGGVGDNVLVEGNEISYNNGAHFNPFWEAGGTKFAVTNNLIVRGNHVHHNDGPGLWTDIDNINTLYENNISEDNAQMGIFHEISYAAVIRNNIVRRNGFSFSTWVWGAGILVAASPNVEIYGNTVEGNADGIAAVQQDRGSGRYGAYQLANLWVHDNTVTMSQGLTGVVEDIDDPSVFTSRNIRFTNNRYRFLVDDYFFTWQDDDRSDAQWKSYGMDVTGTFERLY
jgi:hypothetical protein